MNDEDAHHHRLTGSHFNEQYGFYLINVFEITLNLKIILGYDYSKNFMTFLTS